MNAESKKVLIIDMDEVIYEEWSSRMYCEFMGIKDVKEQRKNGFIQDLFKTKKELDCFVKFFLSKPNYYYGVPLLTDARKIIEKLNEKYSLYICTDYLFKDYEWESDKIMLFKTEVLKRDFPFINPAQYIFMRGKQLLYADILIDDRAHNFGPHVKQKLLFSGQFNAHLTDDELEKRGLIRVNSWKEIGEMLLK